MVSFVRKHRNLIFSLSFAGVLFLQCFLFHFLSFGTDYWPPVTDFLHLCSFIFIKISICLFFAAVVPLFKNRWWTVCFSFIVGLWCEAELVYYRSCSLFIDVYSILMIGNMNGFWDSVAAFLHLKDILVFVPALLLILINRKFKTSVRSARISVIFLLLALFCHVGASCCYFKFGKNRALASGNFYPPLHLNPFSFAGSTGFWGLTQKKYVAQTSVIHGLILNACNLLSPLYDRTFVSLNDDDSKLAEALLNDVSEEEQNARPSTPLYIILVESFENWSISSSTTPVIWDFINSHDNILWCTKVKRQVIGGQSADGQMIVNTGLLPVAEGAACFRFSSNIFPSLSGQYESSAIISPDAIWNQRKMNLAYGIDEFFLNYDFLDSLSMDKLSEIYDEFGFVLVITGASHAPFNVHPEYGRLELSSNMPEKMKRYLTCIHYTDSALREFLAKVDSDDILKSSTILITGDHSIFSREDRCQFENYCLQHNDVYNVREPYCPMIVYSPRIKEKTVIDRECYQMDIYPTILDLIGRDKSYRWKGFGRNLLDSTSVRSCTVEEALSLSDKMIRSNFFKRFE